MRVIHHRVHALRARRLQELLVRLGRRNVGLLRRFVFAGADVDVRRHVHQVSRGGRQSGQPVRAIVRPLRLVRRFHRVDVEVVCADVLGIAPQHALQCADDLFRTFVWTSLLVPQLPRVQVHQAFGIERGCIQIIGILLRQFLHRAGVILLDLLVVGVFRIGVAPGHGGDIVALGLGGAVLQRLRFADGFEGDALAPLIDRKVVVRPDRIRHAPPRHRQLGIQFGGAAEGPLALGVIEAVAERQSLVEELLRFAVRGADLVLHLAEPGHQLRWLGLGQA